MLRSASTYSPLCFPFALLAFTVANAALPAQSVACEKYVLPNGLTVILHEDHKVPLVAINTWFRVGAKDEPPRRSGFAHLFEHLMFMGTRRVPGSQFDEIMEGGGGSNNASTTEDRTNYFSVGPAAQLPTLLWLDADRLEDLGRTIDQAKLDRQREVVENEIRQQEENEPYGRTERATFHLMFPVGHPYHESTYGSHQDLEAATVDDVRDFFAAFYVPDNASLVIAGDFDPVATKALVAKLYGSLPRAPEPTRRVVATPSLDHVVRTTLLDRVQMPMLRMAWHAPAAGKPGTAELDLLAEVLTSGKTSRLYRRLVEQEGIAVDVSAFLDDLTLGSLFEISVFGVPGADLDRIEAIVDEELAKVREQPVANDELSRRQIAHEVGQVAAMQDLGRIADQLNAYEFRWGQPDSFARDLERYRAVTPDAVRAAADRVLVPDRRAILRVLPLAPETKDNPRDERPAELPRQPLRTEAPASFQLSNGMRVLLWRRPELPIAAVRLQIVPGAPIVRVDHAGVAALAASMLDEGAAGFDAAAFAAELESLGATIAAWVDHETATARLFVAQRNFAAGVHRLADAVRRPNLRAADFERVRRVQVGRLQAATEEPATIASETALRVYFGDDDPYGWPATGTPASVQALTLDEVQQEYRTLFEPTHAVFLVAGDVTVDEARTALEAGFGDWRTTTTTTTAAPVTPPLRQPTRVPMRVVLVDRPGAAQTVIHLLAPAPAYGDPARIRLQMLNTLLGGSFTSRLNQNLRERHGYTYGAESAFSLHPQCGWFVAEAGVESSVTGAALKEMLAEFARLRVAGGADVSAAEVAKVQRTMQTQIVESLETLDGLLGSAAEYQRNGLDFTELAHDLDTIAATTADVVNQHSHDDLDLDHAVLVLVGDAAKIRQQLTGLGLPEPIQPTDRHTGK